MSTAPAAEFPPAYVELIEELSTAVQRAHPEDVFQFCANFFNRKLEFQRAQLVALAKTRSASSVSESEDASHDSYVSDASLTETSDEEEEEEAQMLTVPVNANRGRRTSVSAESMDPTADQEFEKIVIWKSEEQRERIAKSIANNFLFKNLDEEQYKEVVDAMAEKHVEKDEVVIQQGAVGDYFYVVETGELDVYVSKKEGELGPKVWHYGPGGSFGELALMYNAPRAATLIACSPCVLWALDRVSFRRILMENTSRKRKMYESFLAEVPLLVSLESYERHKIADALESKTYEEGQVVIKQGDVGDNFYLVESGEAVVTQTDEHGKDHVLVTLKKGSYFGELALINDKPRAATVTAKGRLKVALLGKKAFSRLLGPVITIIKRNAANYQKVANVMD